MYYLSGTYSTGASVTLYAVWVVPTIKDGGITITYQSTISKGTSMVLRTPLTNVLWLWSEQQNAEISDELEIKEGDFYTYGHKGLDMRGHCFTGKEGE